MFEGEVTEVAQRKQENAPHFALNSPVLFTTDPGKVQGPKLDNGSGGFPPFRFGKGGVGGFLLFSCVLLLDYLKEFEKYLLTRRHRAGDDASNRLLQS